MSLQLSPKLVGDAKVDGLLFSFLKVKNVKVAIQANTPWDLSSGNSFYYETQVIDVADKNLYCIGLAVPDFPPIDASVGRVRGSYGYLGENGQLFANGSAPAKYGPSFSKGDVIGVGVDGSTLELFFTRNGVALGVAATLDKGQYFPTVGTAVKSTFKFNFDGPFLFKGQNKPAPVSNQIEASAQSDQASSSSSTGPPPLPEGRRLKSLSSVKPQLVPVDPVPVPAIEGKDNVSAVPNTVVPAPVVPVQASDPQDKAKGPSKGHIMISYQWGSKEFALQIYEALTARRFVVWMDVKGGMTGDIYQSMSEGVEGAVVFVPLITTKYTASPNCRRECSAAADKRKKIIPLMCENINITGWILACISGLLWTECFDNKITKDNMEFFLNEVEKAIPADSPARQPNLSIYISYTQKDRDSAEVIRKILEDKKPPFHCIMSAEEKSGSGTATPKPQNENEPKKTDGILQKSAALEEKLTNAKAVILILSTNFEGSDECKNDISLSYSHRKLIIPVLVKRLKSEYPPRGMEFALRDTPYLDCISMISKPAKFSTISRKLTEALTSGAVTKTNVVEQNENFLIKTVGTWTENDVSQWLNNVGLSQYTSVFKAKHVNGRVLLSLHEKDLDSLQVMKLHQRRFSSAVSTLFNGLNWNEDEVAEWMESVGLSELTPNLYKAHINGQSLLMLTESDLSANDINDMVTQKRILAEIQHLKETEARVPIKDELYRFKILRSVLKPVPTDAKDDTFKFSKEILEFLRHIYNTIVESDQKEAKLAGLTQVSLKRFLFTILVCAGIYHDTYPTKNIWNDVNSAELLSLKKIGDDFIKEALDDLLDSFESITNLDDDNAGVVAENLKTSKIFSILCFNYLILNNIVQRLFAIIDRQVDGVVSWTELLPGLELIVHGSTDDKFKLAMSLVDFNGDGDISKDEFDAFYKDCFLPIVNFCKIIKLEDFEKLNKDSFLYVAYQKVKDALVIGREPTLLNKAFSIKQFHGFLYERPVDLDDIFNVPWEAPPFVWFPYGYHQHDLVVKDKRYQCNACYLSREGEARYCKECSFFLCPSCFEKTNSDPARNIDILGIYTNPNDFTLTNLTFGGRFNCATESLVKNALLWVTAERPDLGAYTKFNNFTKEQADAYVGADKPLFITTDPASNYMAFIDLKENVLVGKFVLIKLLRTFTAEEISKAEQEQQNSYEKEGQEEAQPNEDEEAKEADEGTAKGEQEAQEATAEKYEEDPDAGEGEGEGEGEGDGATDNDSDDSDDDKHLAEMQDKCLVAEFIGLWGYEGTAIPPADTREDAKTLFEELHGKYDVIGSYEKEDDDFKINKFVTQFLRAARDFSDGNEELSPAAREMEIDKKDVTDLLNRLSYLTIVGDNPANALMLLLPIIHLFRLFYGHDVTHILLKPM